MMLSYVTALPVFNEAKHVNGVLDEVLRYGDDVVVIDDGSTDGTAELLAARSDIRVVRHPVNRGYGAALISAFEFAMAQGYDVVVTIDCDGQHEPKRIPQFVARIDEAGADIVSGSRYLQTFDGDSSPPEQRRAINARITEQLNRTLGLQLTDAFCGFKAYRTSALKNLKLTDPGYAMPLELWVQAVCHGLKIVELPVPLIYLDEKRSFGGALDDAERRFAYYQSVLAKAIEALPKTCRETFAERSNA